MDTHCRDWNSLQYNINDSTNFKLQILFSGSIFINPFISILSILCAYFRMKYSKSFNYVMHFYCCNFIRIFFPAAIDSVILFAFAIFFYARIKCVCGETSMRTNKRNGKSIKKKKELLYWSTNRFIDVENNSDVEMKSKSIEKMRGKSGTREPNSFAYISHENRLIIIRSAMKDTSFFIFYCRLSNRFWCT